MKSVIIAILLFLAFVAAAAAASGMNEQEAEKIRNLISSIEDLQGAVFIRNGSEHTPKQAADHLRLKLRKAGKWVKTAEDFIKNCATRSSWSGKTYLIRYDDGTVVTAETFLRVRLAALAEANAVQTEGRP